MKEHEEIFKKNPFSVPTDYFEQLEKKTIFRAQNQVPEGYFENLTERIQAGVFLEKLKSEVSTDGLTVPNGYFDRLEKQILAKTVSSESDAKIRPIKRKVAWIRYAAAACLLLVAGLVLRNNMETQQHMDLDSIPDQELISYLSLYGGTGDLLLFSDAMVDWDSKDSEYIPELSDEDIEWYLENTL